MSCFGALIGRLGYGSLGFLLGDLGRHGMCSKQQYSLCLGWKLAWLVIFGFMLGVVVSF